MVGAAAGPAVAITATWLGLRVSVGAALRPIAPLLVDAGAAAWCAGLVLLATGRPWLTACTIAAGAAGLALTDRVKRAALREPINYADRAELLEVLRHPQLYLPFAGTGRVLAGLAVVLAAVAVSLRLERPITLPVMPRLVLLGALASIYWALEIPALRHRLGAGLARLRPSLDPARDMRRYGMLTTFVVHATCARAERPTRQTGHRPPASSNRVAGGSGQAAVPARPIVVVQGESFFDVGRLGAASAGMLPNFAALARESVQHGSLHVPCWGANTVRTEFTVLSGIGPAALGWDGFNPYERFARTPIESIAWRLRRHGYHTVCVHPFDLRFYGRATVLPLLGFDELVGPEQFASPPSGAYVADSAVTARVAALLARHGPRVFIFAITMQGHGPWHPPAAGPHTDALGCYIQQMRAFDAALQVLREALVAADGVLAVYGDHQPSLPQSLGRLNPATDYLIWHGCGGAGARCDLHAEHLAAAIYAAALDAAASQPAAALERAA